MNKDQIQRIYTEFRVPNHIQRHMQKVAKVAINICKCYRKIGVNLDVATIEAAALLHDALKITTIKGFTGNFDQEPSTDDIKTWQGLKKRFTSKSDAQSMAQHLEELGETQIANLIRKHDFACVLNELETLEEKILYYADKRVKHDQIVSLEERLRDGRIRYKVSEEQLERVANIERAIYKLEEKLFSPLSIAPSQIED